MKYLIVVVASTLLLSGCGKKRDVAPEKPPDIEGGLRKNIPVLDRTLVQNDLKKLAFMYFEYETTNNRPPTRVEDLEIQKEDTKLHRAMQEGKYVVLWNTPMFKSSSPPATTVFAYQKEAATDKGEVMMVNQSCLTMTADELKKALSTQGR